MANLCLSWDHRALDGALAAQFLATLRGLPRRKGADRSTHDSQGQPVGERYEHETLLVRRGRRSDVVSIIAVHSTVLGPALGGCRMWSYPTLEDAIADALRLSAAMTLKAAVAGLPLGGGKSVICLRPARAAADGRLSRGASSTTSPNRSRSSTAATSPPRTSARARPTWRSSRDLTDHVVGRPTEDGGCGDPGPFTAAGVEAAMRACCERRSARADLAGRSVAIVGVGQRRRRAGAAATAPPARS